MLAGVGLALDCHGRMGVIGMVAARRPMAMPVLMTVTMTVSGMIRPAGGVLGWGHRGRCGGGQSVTGLTPFLPNAAGHPRDSPPASACRRSPGPAPSTATFQQRRRSNSAGDPVRFLPEARKPSPCNTNVLRWVLLRCPVPEVLPSPAPRPGPAVDLQRLLIPDPTRTVLLRVGGDSMVGAGIHHGDLVVVERHQAPRDGQLVVARLIDGFTLKRLVLRGERRLLVAAHPAYPTLALEEGELWGVVTHAIRSFSA